MLANLRDVLREADQENKAVPAFNCATLENIRAAIRAAEEMDSSIIIEYAEAHQNFIPIEEIGPIMIDYAKKASVPVAVHLDHGGSLDFIKTAIEIGFTSVMIDASGLPIEENITTTKKVVEYAHSHDVSVEAELGHIFNSSIGAGEGAKIDSASDYSNLDDIYTNPEESRYFVEQTGVDCLAVAFGTVHGIYLEEPKLDFDRVKEIDQIVSVPLVMHGGSGVNEDDYYKLINNGIRKINYYTYANKAAAEAVSAYISENNDDKNLLFDHMSTIAINAMTKNYKDIIKVFNNGCM